MDTQMESREIDRMRFRPCIDLHQGKVKQLVGGTYDDTVGSRLQVNFESPKPASWYAKMYAQDQLYGGHVIAIGPGNEQAAKEALHAFPGGLQIGGGITPENAAEYLDAGAAHVIVTSYVFKGGAIHWENLRRMADAAGKEKLVLDLSCREKDGAYYIVTDRWQKCTGATIGRENLIALGEYCSEFLVHAVDVEGKKAGIDEVLIKLLAEITPLPATYAGGIASLSDLEKINSIGNGRIDATVGSALDIFGGTLSYRQVVAWHKSAQD